ncbi:MAG: hypothetical protein ACE1ZA_11745, partial [Pseudomonadales bacterium]
MTAVNQLPRIVMLATLAVAHWSCGGGDEPTGTTQPPSSDDQVATTLSISPATATLASLGETANFTATATDALGNAITSGFTWQTGN